jgi:hypothetical protein
MDMVRSMLAGKNVPKEFWPEAVKWACYVMNRSPTLSVKNVTPEEAWSGVKPSVHHFRVFGCVAYAHIPDNLRKKLDNKTTVCILLGLSEESKAYKLFDPIQKRIIISRDVVFEENKAWDWNSDGKKNTHDDSIEIEEFEGHTDQVAGTHNETGEGNHGNDNIPEEVPETSSDEEEAGAEIITPRFRKPPARLNDYVSGSEIDDEELQNLANFVASNDPKTYEEAMGCSE